MMTRVFYLNEIDQVAEAILREIQHSKCIAFYAEMGSGKTTLIAALCRALDVVDHVSSPTFAIINEYQTSKRQTIFHMDWYRLKNTEDAIQAGVQDILDQEEAYRFIEWPEVVEELLPNHHVTIRLKTLDEDRREIKVSV